MASEDFVSKYVAQAATAADVTGRPYSADELGLNANPAASISNVPSFLAATVADMGTSLWNSVISIPKLWGGNHDEYRADTYELLKGVNEDWAAFYSGHQEAVQTASFIGGVLVPAGAAMKGMKLLQAGKLGFYPATLSDAAQTTRMSELQGMLELGGKATTEYRNLRWSILAANAGQETLMAAGTEIAVIGAMSAHPMMEDYMKDPVKNFFIWAAVGGVIGTAMGQISTRKLLADTMGAVETEALDPVLAKLIAVPKGIAIGDSIQRFGANVTQMEGIIADKSVKPITRQWAENFADQFRGIIGKLETEGGYFAAELKTAAPEVRQGAREVGMSDAAFGANQVNILTYDTKEFVARKRGHDFLTVDMATLDAISTKYEGLWKAGYRVRSALIASNAIKEFSPDWARLMNEEFHVGYSPFHKAWIPQSELPFYSRAVDTGQRTYSKVSVFKIDTDASFQFGTREIPSATVDKQWVDALGTVANAQLERSIYVASGDIAVQNALLSRLSALEAEGKPVPKVFITPDAAGNATQSTLKAQGKEVTLSGLEDNLAREKERQIKSLLKAGASLQEIGIKTNMGTDAVEHFLQTRQPLNARRAGDEALNTNWRLYTNAGAIDTEYLGQTGRMLQFSTNGYRKASLAHRNADMSANLDSKAISQANRGYMENTIAGGQSNVLKEWFQVLASDNRDWDILASEVSNIVNSKMGSSFTTSADFAARRMGSVGGIATRKGQEAFGFNNRISQEWLTPVATQLRAFTTTQSGLNEFNRVVNLVNGTSGYIGLDAKTGQLFRRVEHEPGVFMQEPLRNAEGTVVSMSSGLSTLLQEVHKVTREQYEMKNVLNRIQGFKDMNDRGLYLPTFNPVNKFISYVIDKEAAEGASKVRILMAKSPDELASMERDWTSKHGSTKSSTGGTKYDLVTKSKQEDYNFWKMREDPLEMDHTDISKFHSGASASATDVFDDVYASTLVENLHNRFIHYGRKMQEMYLHDTMSTLDMMSAANKQFFAAQPTAARSVGVAQREDAAMFIKNTILGNPQLNQFTTWQSFNNSVSSIVEYAGRKVTDTWRNAAYRDKEQRVLKEGEYVRIAKELGDHGAVNPFKSYDEYVSTRTKMQGESQYKLRNVTDLDEVQGLVGDNLGIQAGEKVFAINIKGVDKGFLAVTYNNDSRKIWINMIKTFDDTTKLGITEMKVLGQQLKAEFPNATIVVGERISGMRTKQGRSQGVGTATDEFGNQQALEAFSFPLVEAPIPSFSASQAGKRAGVTEMETLRVQEIARKHAVPYARAEQIVAANNGILATVALRVLETGQAAVTAMSWPIMMLPEFYRAFPKTYLGNAVGEGISVAYPARAIYDGIRFRHSDMAQPLIKQWIDQGFGKSIVSEASSINTTLSMGEIGMMGKIQKALESPTMKKISFASDFMEGETRLWVLSTGYMAAKRIYPGISVHDADAFAKEFLMKSIGNYYSAQRPAMFQGTFGVAIGLFQTYMLSWGQSMYRSIEEGAGKAIAAQMLSQAGLFGMSSLPLYDQFSKIIGSNFSDKHYDLQTGTYRAMPDKLAEFVTYGLPASLGVGLYTRGDMQPRVPFTQTNGLDTFAAINVARQLYGATGHTISKVLEANGMSDKVRGLLEGLSMQSLSRPLARIVETIPLPDGQGGVRAVGSISRDGNTISTSEDIWSGPGLASRLLASRSTEEAVKREVDYLNTFYGALDHQNRKHATETLKSSIRSGTLNDETLSKTAATYLRTGTAVGWKAALNEALATTEGGIDYKLGKTLRPDSPLQKMIDQYK